MSKEAAPKRTTIYHKISKSMSGISVSFILIMLLCSIYIFSHWFFQAQQKSSQEHLQYIAQQIDTYLTTVENYSRSIIINSTVHEHVVKFVKEEQPFTASDQSAISMEINRTVQSTPFIHSVTVYSDAGEVISSTELKQTPTHIDGDYLYPMTDGIWLESVKTDASRQQEIKTFSFIRPFWDYASGQFIGYLEIAVPEQSISQIYASKADSLNRYHIANSQNRIISSDNPQLLDTGLSSLGLSRVPGPGRLVSNGFVWFTFHYDRLNWNLLYGQDLFYYLRPFGQVLLIFLVLAAVCIVVCFLPAHHISSNITRPIYRLIAHTEQIKKGNWAPVSDASYDDYDMQVLYESFNSMLAAQEQLKNDLVTTQKYKDQIKLDLLQQQINPHFLYNTLDNICALAELDEKDALMDIVMSLSTFYRKGLSNGKTFVTLREEIRMTEAYLHIMSIRYINKFHYTLQCPKSLYDYPCLKLLLQPIVENSIYHGIKEISEEGILTIQVFEDGDDILLCVEDNGKGIDEEKLASILKNDTGHFGIKNIHERIQIYYGTQYGLSLSSRKNGGCRTVIRISKGVSAQ